MLTRLVCSPAAEKAGLTIIGEATRDPYLYILHLPLPTTAPR